MTPDSSSSVESTVPEDDDTAVLDALHRVLSSATFRGSDRSRALLSFVVTETLAGRGDQLTAHAVSRAGEPPEPGADGPQEVSVRVRATRLRKALTAYYAGEGAVDPVRIELPPGGYTPVFTLGPNPQSARDALEMALMVMVFDAVGEAADAVAAVVAEALVSQLSRFPGLRVLGPGTARTADPRRIGRGVGARFVLQGSVVRNGSLMRLSARATDAGSGEVIWAVADSLSQDPDDLAGIADGWVAEVAGELGDYAGVLLPRATRAAGDAGAEGQARLSFSTYILEGTNDSLHQARRTLGDVVAAGSRAPDVLAMYANTLAISAMYRISDDVEADLEDAERLARQSLAEDPRGGAHAQLVLGQVALARRQWEVAAECARQGARKAAGHPTTLATAGVTLCLAGAWEDGVALTREALRLNQAHPAYMHGPLAAERILNGDDAAGLAEAALLTSSDTYHGPFWRAMALAGLGYLGRAKAEFAAAVAAEPALADDPAGVVAAYANVHPDHMALILDRVRLIQA